MIRSRISRRPRRCCRRSAEDIGKPLTLTLTLTLPLSLSLTLTRVLTLTLSLRRGRAQRTSVTLCVTAILYFYAAATEALGESASSSRAELVERETASMGAEAG